jgi:CBS domain-containing protein
MMIGKVMSRDVKVIRSEDTLGHAAEIMRQLDIGGLPVQEGDRLVGMLTDRDIAVRGIGEGKGPDAKVHEAMTAEIRYCYEDEEVEAISENLSEQQVRRLPAVNRDKRLVGIISLGDLATTGSLAPSARALHWISQPGGPHNQSRE